MPSVESSLMLVTIVTDGRSVSPMTPSPSKEMRGIRLFRAISRKLVRRSNEELHFSQDPDSRSSSADSYSSASTSRSSRVRKENNDSGFRSVSPNHLSSSSSEAGSDIHARQRHHHSTSAESLRRVFQHLNLTSRSQSCNNTKEKKNKKPPPKKILRQPVSYTYVKGLSGLPTQRIPRAKIYSTCGCSMQYISGLNR